MTVAATAVETDDKAIVSGQFSTAAILRRIERVYPEETPTPRGFRGTLRPYQRQSLAFALNRERGAVTGQKTHFMGGIRGVQGVRGGIIADEVGMGKTAVAVALVLANPRNSKRASDSDYENFYRVLTQKPPPPLDGAAALTWFHQKIQFQLLQNSALAGRRPFFILKINY